MRDYVLWGPMAQWKLLGDACSSADGSCRSDNITEIALESLYQLLVGLLGVAPVAEHDGRSGTFYAPRTWVETPNSGSEKRESESARGEVAP
jgi:hypothetical protein